MDFSLQTFFWAFLGGLLPALLWLWFWLKEDKKHPEPKLLIFFAFVAGMSAVIAALFLERWVGRILAEGTLLIIIWAAIEEILKYLGAYFVAFRGVCLNKSKCLDEPIDPMIYMVTVALGFAALENTLFLLTPLAEGATLVGIVTGNLRFVGATVLHVVASAAIGAAISFSFYKSRLTKRIMLLVGIFTAIALHTLFNLSILVSSGKNFFGVFSILWVAALMILLIFEKVKRIRMVRGKQ